MNQPPLEPGYRYVEPHELLPEDAEYSSGDKWVPSFFVGHLVKIATTYRTRTPYTIEPGRMEVIPPPTNPPFEAIQQAWLEGWTAAQQPDAGPVQAAWLASKARKRYQSTQSANSNQ